MPKERNEYSSWAKTTGHDAKNKKQGSVACSKNKALLCKPNMNNGYKHAIQNRLFFVCISAR